MSDLADVSTQTQANAGDDPQQLAFAFALKAREAGKSPRFEQRLQQDGLHLYWEHYQHLVNNPPHWEKRFWQDHPNRKRQWRKRALYIVWKATPRKYRQPATMDEFGKLVGVTRQALWLWEEKTPEVTELINNIQFGVIESGIQDVDFVTYYQATAIDSSVAARRLAYERYEQAREVRDPGDETLVQVLEALRQIAE